MASSSASSHENLPPLLALPNELKLDIISHITHDEYPSLACLRRTHTSFLKLIPKSHIRASLSDTELSNQLLKTELEYSYLLPPAHYPCYRCARILPLERFTHVLDRHSDNYGYGPRRSPRFCDYCCTLKTSSYQRSYSKFHIWFENTLDELPMPPARPRLRSSPAHEESITVDYDVFWRDYYGHPACIHGRVSLDNDFSGAE